MRHLRLVVLACLLSVDAAFAQGPVTFGVGAGPVIPSGSFADDYSAGIHLLVAIETRQQSSRLGFRLDGMWSAFNGRNVGGSRGTNQRIAGASANAVYAIPGDVVHPYVLGGGGYYATYSADEGSHATHNVGVNAGIGAHFTAGTFRAFAEVRVHSLPNSSNALQFIPLTFGVIF